jgi:hypothetical protein
MTPGTQERYRTRSGTASRNGLPCLSLITARISHLSCPPHTSSFALPSPTFTSCLEMSTSTHAAESLYSQLINPSGSHIDLYVYALMDYDHHYQCYPTSMIRSTFESVLPHLQTRFAVQASNSAIEAVIDQA